MQIGGFCKALKTGVMITGVLFVTGICILTGVEIVKKYVFNTSTLNTAIGEIPEIDESGNSIISKEYEDSAEKCKDNSEEKVTGKYEEGSKESIHSEKSKHAEEKNPVGPEKNNKREESPKILSESVVYDKKEDINSNPIILDRKEADLTIGGHSDENNINTLDKETMPIRQSKDLKEEVPANLPEVSKDKVPAQLPEIPKDEAAAQLPEIPKDEAAAQLPEIPKDEIPQSPEVPMDEAAAQLPLQKEKMDNGADQVLKSNFDISNKFINHESHITEEKQEEKQINPKILNTDANILFMRGEGTKDNEL
ncbi:hypothetical protein NEQG_01992 [Nematocida parisii ERTm3]|uniref:Uncharacterized protein n=1 Tax=Nematocida parisii (strain ERTm3) TaxID=935791 RepID=I3EFC3_NEMP3|nr:hypothetical protein NEQG_01992 [Nematocida parisii ERTm3]